jgi:hypothetical protein
MRLLFLAASLLVLIVPFSSAAAPPAPRPAGLDSSHCPGNALARRADQRAPAPRVRNLGDLPAGNLTLAVVRQVGGCNQPVTVRYGYGAAEPRPRARR